METKICNSPDCTYQGQPQPIENFYKNSYSHDGLHSICKDCKNRHIRAKYQRSPEVREAVVNRVKEYKQTKHGKLIRKKTEQNYLKRYPDKRKARDAVNGKIENNKRGNGLPHPSSLNCAHCGKQAQEYHHHNGYDEKHWLDVIPLCADCHTLVHLKT